MWKREKADQRETALAVLSADRNRQRAHCRPIEWKFSSEFSNNGNRSEILTARDNAESSVDDSRRPFVASRGGLANQNCDSFVLDPIVFRDLTRRSDSWRVRESNSGGTSSLDAIRVGSGK